MLPAGVLTDSSSRVAQWERLFVLLPFQPWFDVATHVNSGGGFCWCRLLEPGGSVHASSKRLATCLLLEPGSSVHAGSKRLAMCVCTGPTLTNLLTSRRACRDYSESEQRTARAVPVYYIAMRSNHMKTVTQRLILKDKFLLSLLCTQRPQQSTLKRTIWYHEGPVETKQERKSYHCHGPCGSPFL